jgi:hypothetical protein
MDPSGIQDRGYTNESFVMLMQIWIKSVREEKLGGALRVTQVYDLLSACFGFDEIEVCWDIILCHFINCEIPVLRLAGTELGVLVRVCGAPTVGDPNIIPIID